MSRAPAGPVAEQLHGLLGRAGQTIAVAESLTGGLVSAALTTVPGSSATFRGAVVVYATDLKHELAGVPVELLAAEGPVSRPTAEAMASGVRRRLGADWGLALTGVAGPDPQDEQPVGTVHVALAGPGAGEGGGEPAVRSLVLDGDRSAIRDAAVAAALQLVVDTLTGE